jgi:N-methylhydantoinase A
VDVKMGEAIRAISTQRGYDLQDFTLVAFGGAGPVHAGSLALDLGIRTVLVPPHPGAHSALGLLMCPVRHDYVRTRLAALEHLTASEAEAQLAALEALARDELAREGFGSADVDVQRFADLRYRGQGYEITVPLPSTPWDGGSAAAARARFDQVHAQLYGHAAPDQPVELVSYRVAGIGRITPALLPDHEPCSAPLSAARLEIRPVRFPGAPGEVSCPVYDRALLGPGHAFAGPAVVEQFDSTVVVPPGMRCRVDPRLNLILERGDG